MPQQFIDFVVAGGKLDPFGGRSGFKQRADGLGRGEFGPVGIDTSFDGEFERGPVLPVPGIDRCATRDQFIYDVGSRAPRSNVQGGAVLCDAEVAVSFTIESGHAYT